MNSLFQQLNKNQNPLSQNNITNAFRKLKSMGNPNTVAQMMLQKNPQLKQLIDNAGGDPKRAFYNLAQQQGVNPNDVLNMMK